MLERLLEQRVRLCELSEPDEHAADVGQRLRLVCDSRRERGRPLEEVERSRQVAAIEGALTGRGRAGCMRGHNIAAISSLTGPSSRPEPERLLEVVADDLLVLRYAVSRRVGKERREALVQLGASLLRHAPVRGITDEDVAEPVGVLSAQQLSVG